MRMQTEMIIRTRTIIEKNTWKGQTLIINNTDSSRMLLQSILLCSYKVLKRTYFWCLSGKPTCAYLRDVISTFHKEACLPYKSLQEPIGKLAKEARCF